MKYIMLDIDGVLNSEWSFQQRIIANNPSTPIDTPHSFHIHFLNRILNEVPSVVVISSTWRFLHDFADLKNQLESCGIIPGRVLDQTPILHKLVNSTMYTSTYTSTTRGAEIRAWMKQHNVKDEDVIILDDDDDMDDLLPRLIQTKFETGLQEEHYLKAIEMLK